LSVVSGAAIANEVEPLARLAEDAFFDDLPVVLSVSRLAQPLRDAPGSVTVIDAETIHSSGARDLADLLRMVPGFLVAHSFNGAPNAVYHGMTDENPRGLQILIDGRSQYSPLFFGGVAWNLIDVSLDEIERVEVIRGSNSAAYGSNAFLGVVNVVTYAAAETQGVRVRVGEGNDGVADRYARIGMNIGHANVRLSAETMHDNGVQHFDDRRRHQRVNLRADVPLGAGDELQVQAGNAETGLRTGEAGVGTDPPREQKATKEFLSLALQRSRVDGGGLSLRYIRSNEVFDDAFVARAGPLSLAIDYHTSTTRDELELQHTLVPAADMRLVWGAGARYDAVRGPQFYGKDGAVRQNVYRLFGNFEWRPSVAWTTNLGLTWENDSLSDTSLAPRLAVNYHLSPRQTLRAGVSRAHRIPSLTESRSREYYGAFDTSLAGLPFGVRPLEIERDASGRLDKEMIDVEEIGYLGDFREHGAFLDVRVFREKVRDRILPVTLRLVPPNCEVLGLLEGSCGAYKDYMNGQDVEIRGAEYQLRWRPRRGTELTLNQTFISIESRAHAALRAGNRFTASNAERHMEHSAPDRATMLRWTQQLPGGLEASIAHFRYGWFQWTLNTSVDAFQRTDVRLAYPFRAGPTRGEVALTVQGVDGRRAEFRRRGADRDDPDFAPPQFLDPRGWVSLALEF